jgi:hypothetical protein
MVGWYPLKPRWSPAVFRVCVLACVLTTQARGQETRTLPFVPAALARAVDVPPAVIAARAEVRHSAARQGAAGAPALWLLSAGASEVPEADFGAGNVRLELGRDILAGPRRAAERAAAGADLERATGALTGALRRADGMLIRAASRALGWERIRRRRAAQDSLLTTAEGALHTRFGAGEARFLDVLRLRTERLRAASALASAQAEGRSGEASLLAFVSGPAGRVQLQTVLTEAQEAGEFLEGRLPEVPPVDSLIANSTALVLARSDIKRLQAERARDLAERGMQGSAFAGIQRIGSTEGGATWGPTLGLTLSLPFLTGGSNDRIRAAGDSGVSAAEARLAAVEADVAGRIAAAAARYLGASERVGIYEAALLSGARAERDVALANYRDGTLSLLELLDFERALVDAEVGRLESLLAAADAWADLLEAQGSESPTSVLE